MSKAHHIIVEEDGLGGILLKKRNQKKTKKFHNPGFEGVRKC